VHACILAFDLQICKQLPTGKLHRISESSQAGMTRAGMTRVGMTQARHPRRGSPRIAKAFRILHMMDSFRDGLEMPKGMTQVGMNHNQKWWI